MNQRTTFSLKNPVIASKTLTNYILLTNDIWDIMHKLADAGMPAPSHNFFMKFALIYTLVREYKPLLMVETGVQNGNSTYFILKAMQKNKSGRLISIDLPQYNKDGMINEDGQRDTAHLPEGKEPGWLVTPGLCDRWKLVKGNSREILPKINGLPDAFMHDSEHSHRHMTFELEWAFRRLKMNNMPCLLICNGIDWNNAYGEFIEKHKIEVESLQNKEVGIARVYNI